MFEKGNRGNTLHGILLIALFSFAAFYIAEIPFVKRLSFSPLIVGIILGMLYANSLRNRLPETWVPGIKFCTKQVLRAGIVLYGFRLTLAQVFAVGLPAIIVDAVIVGGTLLLGVWLGRLLKIDRDTALLTSTGSAICGAAAVLGAEPVVRCEGHKTAIAVSTVVVFGTISMFLYPVMYRSGLLDGLNDMEVAIYTGSTLHEVAHVAGAGNAMDPTDALGIAGTATITKMIRVMMLAPVLVIMGIALSARRKDKAAGKAGKSKQFACLVGRAAETVEHTARKLLGIRTQDIDKFVVGRPAMDHQRQAETDRPFHLTAEDLNLLVAARIVPIEIEPDLAHGNETPVSSQHPLHLVEYRARIGREFCRMKPQHREAKSGISLTQSQHGRH